MESIENDDVALQTTISSVEVDVGTNAADTAGKREYFDLAAAHLLPKDPVTKKRVTQKSLVVKPSDVRLVQETVTHE